MCVLLSERLELFGLMPDKCSSSCSYMTQSWCTVNGHIYSLWYNTSGYVKAAGSTLPIWVPSSKSHPSVKHFSHRHSSFLTHWSASVISKEMLRRLGWEVILVISPCCQIVISGNHTCLYFYSRINSKIWAAKCTQIQHTSTAISCIFLTKFSRKKAFKCIIYQYIY